MGSYLYFKDGIKSTLTDLTNVTECMFRDRQSARCEEGPVQNAQIYQKELLLMTNPVPKSRLGRTKPMRKDKAHLILASKMKLRSKNKLRGGGGEARGQSLDVLGTWGKQVSRQLSDPSTAKSRSFVSII